MDFYFGIETKNNKKEMHDMEGPKLKNWCWHYKLKWENFSDETVIALAKFIDNGVVGERIVFKNPIRLRGLVFDRPGIADNTEVITSDVVSVECLPALAVDPTELTEHCYCGSRFVAVTKSKTRYEFVEYGPDGMSGAQLTAMETVFNYERM